VYSPAAFTPVVPAVVVPSITGVGVPDVIFIPFDVMPVMLVLHVLLVQQGTAR
jgi:hypothetical protein